MTWWPHSSSIARSGHRSSHIPQPLQLSGCANRAFSFSSKSKASLGQNATQIPHPLHHSLLITGFFFSLSGMALLISQRDSLSSNLADAQGRQAGVQIPLTSKPRPVRSRHRDSAGCGISVLMHIVEHDISLTLE